MTQVIIFEGADRIGKTTLIKRISVLLRKKYKIKIIHCGGTTSSNPYLAQKRKFYRNYHKCINEKVDILIMDRGYFGEIVYSEIFNRKNPDYISELHSLMLKHCNVFHFFCFGEPYLENLKDSDKKMLPHHQRVSTLFLTASILVDKSNRQLLHLPIDDVEFENIVQKIHALMK